MKKKSKKIWNRMLAFVLCTIMVCGIAVQHEAVGVKAAGEVRLAGCSLTVSEGALGMNLFLSGLSDAQAANCTLQVDGTAHSLEKQSDGTYKATHFVIARDVPKKLSISLFSATTQIPLANAGAVNGTYSYSVKDYLATLEGNNDAMGRLAKAIDDYGTCAYYYFTGANSIPVEIKDADLSSYAMVKSGSLPAAITYAGSCLVLGDTIAIRHYFDVSAPLNSYELLVDGKPVEIQIDESRVNKYNIPLFYVEIPNIRAWDIDHAYTFKSTADGLTLTMKYSVLSYAQVATAQNKDQLLCKLVKSIYWYKVAFLECLEGTHGTGTDTSDYMNSKYTIDMPTAVIVVPSSATAEEQYSAKLLQKYVEEEDGYQPEIISDSVRQGTRGFEISVGNTNRPHGTAAYASNDSYAIKSYNGGIAITGIGKLGLMHGAMRFLEACGGYYYLSWNDLYVTNQKHFKYEPMGVDIDYERAFLFTDIDVCFSSINPAGDLTDPYYGKGKPSGYEYPRTGRLFSLAFGFNGFYADTYCLPKSEAGRETWYLTANKSSQYGDETPISGLAAGQAHTLGAEFFLAKDYFDKHPEWFAAYAWYESGELQKPDSQRKRTEEQLCPYMLLHDPEAYNIVLQHCRDMIANSYDPNAPIQIISISKNDGDKLCTCSYCLKDRAAHGDSGGLYEAVEYVQLLNKVSQDLHANGAYPNLYIDMLAYEWTVEAPPTGITCDDHVIVRYAPIRRCYGDYLNATPNGKGHVTNAKYYQELVNWTKICKHVWIWDYNSNFTTTVAPYANVDVMQHDIKLYKQLGVEGVYLQSNSRHLESNSEFGDVRNYIEGRMLQDPSRNYEEELAFITDALYGKAGIYVREYMKHMEKQARNHHAIVNHRDDVYMYDRYVYNVYAGVHWWNEQKVIDGRMPDEEIGYCEGLWKEINKIAAGESAAVRKRLARLEISWRLVKSTLNVYEFNNPSTYKSQNELLIKDMKAAGIEFFSAISAKTINNCNLPQNHPDNWYPIKRANGTEDTSDRTIGTFTSTNPGGNLSPEIPKQLFVFEKP